MDNNQKLELAGIPLSYFALLAVLVLGASFFTYGPKNDQLLLPFSMIGAWALMVVAGSLLNEAGNRTPILNTYLGGGPIAIIFGMAILVYLNVVPAPVTKYVGEFMGKIGFLDWYIAALITGSILGMNRTLLVRASARYIPAILGGVVVSLVLVGIVGSIVGYGWKASILFIGIPIMGGGMGAGAVPLSKVYAGSTGQDAAKLLSMMIPAVALGNALSVVSGSLLDSLGKRRPAYTGNGQLMVMKDDTILTTDQKPPLKMDMLGAGMLLASAFYILGMGLSLLIPQVHGFALMIICVAMVKALNLLPKNLEAAAYYWFQFMVTNLTSALLVGIGVSYTNFGDIVAAFNWQYLLMVAVTVFGAIAGSWVVGKAVGFYPIESSITAGLCMSNMGGTGDVAVLGASKRMELMPFAQISSRIGGAIMLIIGSALISLFK